MHKEILNLIVNYGTIVAFCAFCVDLVLEIQEIQRIKSSEDVSLRGTIIRLLGGLILLVKFYGIHDIFLFSGQALLLLILIIYIHYIIKYRNK